MSWKLVLKKAKLVQSIANAGKLFQIWAIRCDKNCLWELLPPPRRLCFCRTLFVCLSVCEQNNSKSYGRIFLKFWGYVGHGTNYQWLNFGGDPAGILNSELLWNFRYHRVKGDIREPLAKWRWWRHLANSFALAKVAAGYDCFLVVTMFDHAFMSYCNAVISNNKKLLLTSSKPYKFIGLCNDKVST